MERPNKVHAAAVPRPDVEAPTSHLHPGLTSARARLENEESVRIVESMKIAVRMRLVDMKTAGVSRTELDREQQEQDRDSNARSEHVFNNAEFAVRYTGNRGVFTNTMRQLFFATSSPARHKFDLEARFFRRCDERVFSSTKRHRFHSSSFH